MNDSQQVNTDVYTEIYEDMLDPSYPGNFFPHNNPEIIYGAPGCGKTTYLLEKLSEMLEQYDSKDIAFVSFTNKGIDVGKYRARDQFGLSWEDTPYFRTLHSMAFMLGKFSRDDLLMSHYKFLKSIGFNTRTYISNSFMTDTFTSTRNIYVELHNLKRNNIEKFRTIPEDKYDQAELEYYETMYTQFKARAGLYDFTDILYYTLLNKLMPEGIKVAVIDEAQDLTKLQWVLCFHLFQYCERVFVAGDDDQAIYEWGGSDVDIFLKVYGRRTILDTTYRLTPTIFSISHELVHEISNRQEKYFKPVSRLDEKESSITVLHNQEILIQQLKKPGTYYLLARTTYMLAFYETILMEMQVPFNRKGAPSVTEKLMKGIRLFLVAQKAGTQVGLSVPDAAHLNSVFEHLDLTVPWYYNRGIYKDDKPMKIYRYEEAMAMKNYNHETFTDLRNKFTISTIHGVKGGEADNVLIALDYPRSVADGMDMNRDTELRCLYVAITRAKQNLMFYAGQCGDTTSAGSYIDVLENLNSFRSIVDDMNLSDKISID